MAGIGERKHRLPGGPRQQYAEGTGGRPEGYHAGKTSGGALGDDFWERYPQLEEHRGTNFQVGPGDEVMSRNVTAGRMESFRDQAGDVEMTDEEWEAFLSEVVMASEQNPVAGEDPGFFRRLFDLLF